MDSKDLNLVLLVGRLVAPPEHRVFDSGSQLLRLLLAIHSDHPRRRLDVVPVTLWDPAPELCDGGLRPGDRLWAVGSVQRRFWEAVEGRRSRLEVVAAHVAPHHDPEGAELDGARGGESATDASTVGSRLP